MRYAILGDIHSNLEALNAVLAASKRENIDRYLCVGDCVGYATNPKECLKIIKELASVTIAGNHDWASVNLFSLDFFFPIAQEAIFWTRRNLNDEEREYLASLKLTYKNEDLTVVHGTLNNPRDFDYLTDGYIAEETFRLMQTNICFVGHTHVAGVFIKDSDEQICFRSDESCDIKNEFKYIVNVGSVGQPRDDNIKAAYCIYDTEKKLACIKRVDYDVQSARQKIIDCGLPKYLGDRLLIGR